MRAKSFIHCRYNAVLFQMTYAINRVQQIWFFCKLRTQNLWWVQNLNLRHIYLIRFFYFWRRFLRVWLQSLKNMTFIKYDFKKNWNWKMKKVSKNPVRVEKVHISITFLLISFFSSFKKNISTDLNSAWNSALLPVLNFLKKIVLVFLAFFLNFECKCAREGSKKPVLEFN